ncbi:hypothetical protein [Robbsia sp. KACC 23696]|uniref:hypothetical protein n=1 Tax=Robbsia sp. KACC 23696 TaxID=3149231 RepID=UPI00325B62AD
MSESVDRNWANVLTREARGLIASALLQSVAHRTRVPRSEPWTTVESRDLRRTQEWVRQPDGDDDLPVVGPLQDIRAALARVTMGGNGDVGDDVPMAHLRPDSTGNAALDDAIAGLPDRALGGDKDAVHIVGIFSTDSMIQRIGLRELFNREARLLFVAQGGDIPAPPKFYRWQQGPADEAEDRQAPALPSCTIPAEMDAGLWRTLAREGLLNAHCRAWLGGFFTSVAAQSLMAEARQSDWGRGELRLRLVGHGTTIDADGRHPLRRFAHTPAAALAAYLSTAVLPVFAPSAPSAVSSAPIRIDFVACALAVPGECATSRHSYIGVFLRTLHERDKTGPLMRRICVSACSHVLMFQPGNFKKRREIVVAGLTLTPTREQLREFGLASMVTVAWQRGAPWHRDSDEPKLSQRERVLLHAYAAAWMDWEKRGRRWHKKDMPSRFVLLDNLMDTAIRLEHPDDIAIFQAFVDRVSPGGLNAGSTVPSPETSSGVWSLGNTWRPAAMRPRSKAVPIKPFLRTVSLDHGQWRAHYDTPLQGAPAPGSSGVAGLALRLGRNAEQEAAVPWATRDGRGAVPSTGSLEGCAVSLALALQKIMTSRACLAGLSKAKQKALRRYYMTPWRLVDEAIFRRIGLPANGNDFVVRWKALASPSRPVRVGGEVLHGLITIGSAHDAKAARRVIDLALYQGALGRLTDPDRQAFLSGDGAVVYYGGDVDRARDDTVSQASPTAMRDADQRVGWHVHAFENGQPVCQIIPDAACWETALGALGKSVTKQAADVLREIDAVRLRLVKAVARTVPNKRGTEGTASPSTSMSDADSANDAERSDGPGGAVEPTYGPRADAGRVGGDPPPPGAGDLAIAQPIWLPWCDARARRTVDDDRHGCSGSPSQ